MDSTTATHTEAPPNGVGFNVFAVARPTTDEDGDK